jgi:arylformamidase
MKMKIHDISMLIDEQIITYPGDMGVSIQQIKKIPQDEWNLTGITLGVHTGTHLDSPLHVAANEKGIPEIDLKQCFGEAIVVDLTSVRLGESITAAHFEELLRKGVVFQDKIVLLKTQNSSVGYVEFREDWVGLDLSAADFLCKQKIKAVGIDSLTIGEKDPHQRLLLSGIVIYEGLVLEHIIPKSYTFAGFPLKLQAEGAFVRAVLIED